MPIRLCLSFIFSIFIFHEISAQQPQLSLMPVPAEVSVKPGKFRLDKNFSINVNIPHYDSVLFGAVNEMYQTLNRRTGIYFIEEHITKGKVNNPSMVINVGKAAPVAIGMDESYSIAIDQKKVLLSAPNTVGALRGLQTILQLENYDKDGYYFPSVVIKDKPRFSWRGLMIDVSRHFIPIDVLQRNIEAMAYVKMNVLHLHLSDDQGFRVESKLFPELTGKGSNGEYYTQDEIKGLVQFAENRGIIIVPEFDMPGHATSWFAGYPQLASAPGPYYPGAPFKPVSDPSKPFSLAALLQAMQKAPIPSFNPADEKVYAFLDKFFGEMKTLFPSPYFHIGADENNGVAWKNNPSIAAFMKKKNFETTHQLQEYFVTRVHAILSKHNKKMIGWEELFSEKLPTDVTVQVWSPMAAPGLTKKVSEHGNNIIYSKGFYLDLFMPAGVHYQNPIPDGVNLGGEAAQWTEIADAENIEARIWPRAAAIAERFWSPESVTDVDDMYRRLFVISNDLDDIGLMHKANYGRMVRRIAQNQNTEAVKTLLDVLTPIKGYKRLFAGLAEPESIYQSTPLISVADIVWVDSETKWKFREEVKSWLKSNDPKTGQQLLEQLSEWKNNDEKLKENFSFSPRLKAVEEQSKNLSKIAEIGIEAINKRKSNENIDTAWVDAKLKLLKDAGNPVASTELAIVREIESLVNGRMIDEPKSYPLF